jgi:hypothetical protein
VGCPAEIRAQIIAKLRSQSSVPPELGRATSTVASRQSPASSSTVAHDPGEAASTVASTPAAERHDFYGGPNDSSSTVAQAHNLYGGLTSSQATTGKETTVIIPPVVHTVAPRGAAVRSVSSSITSTVAQVETDGAQIDEPESSDGDLRADTNSFVGLFQQLLHLSIARTGSAFKNEFSGDFQVVTTQLLRAHFAGDVSLGFVCLEDGTSRGDALFGAIDIDAHFPRRLPVLHRALKAVGGEGLARAAFATSGSDDGRGKVIVSIERPMAASDVRLVMSAVKRAALADPAFGHMQRADEIELRPLGGAGGLLRILGRNRGKDRPGFVAPVETPITLDGELADLTGVHPLSVARVREIAAAQRTRNADRFAWVEGWLAQAWTYREEDGNTRGIFRRMVALANASLERYGPQDGLRYFRAWCATVASNSPALDAPSPTNKDRRNPVRHEPTLARAWRYALTRERRWEPVDLVGSGLHPSHVRAYTTLADYAYSRSLTPEFFSITYEFIALELLGEGHKKTVWKQIQVLVNRGLVVIHDSGLAMRRDERGDYRKGLPTIMGLVGRGQTPHDVVAAVQSNPRLYTRVAKRARDRGALLAPKRNRKTVASAS